MIKVLNLESLKYFEKVSRCQKGLLCVIAFFVFWLINQMVFSLKFIQIEQLLIGIFFPIAIISAVFLGYTRSFQIDRGDNCIDTELDLPKLIIFLNKCGFELKEKIGDYYLMRTKFSLQHYKQITVKSVASGCIVFGDAFLIKMLKTDLATLKAIYIAAKS
jgi:hypothetical protein